MNKKLNTSRRNFLVLSASAALATLYLGAKNSLAKKVSAPNLVTKVPTAHARLGINLAGPADWNAELPFVDLFRMSREWISQPKAGVWGSGPKLDLDENGWLKSLEKDCHATRIISSLSANQYPSGDYIVLYDGEGEIKSPSGKIIKNEPGRIVLKVGAKKDSFFIDLIKTNPQNHLRNIRVIMPGFESSYQADPWHPSFLNRWSGVACIRLMDFMNTKLTDASFASKGMPLELMVDLANRLNADAWFCMPHQADDDYCKQFALYVKANLKPELRAWVEYSNEIWNGGFKQHHYAAQTGQHLKFADKPWESAWRYYAYRSVQIFKIWDNVYNGHDRFVRVLASQAANEYASDQMLGFQDAASQADVLAIAPYVSFNVSTTDENGINDKAVSTWSLGKLFEHLNKTALPESLQWVKNSKKVADQYGLKLVSYEAGQHLVGVGGAENNDKLTQLFTQANADQRMGDIYAKSLMMWNELGGDLNCSYCSVGGWSKWGSWGLLQHYADSPKSSPKLMATIKWAISRGQNMVL